VSRSPEGLTEAEQQERRAAIPAIFAKTPYLSWLGLVVERYEPDDVPTSLPFRLEFSSDGSTYHGGVVGSVIDTTGALAAWSNHDFDRGMRASPVSMALQYVAGSSGRSPVFGAQRPPCARAHLHRDHRDRRVRQGPRARTADLPHRLNRGGQRNLMTLPVMSPAASEAR
jgi:acyl-coenzyme A thioesterase PaaI-like protein